MADNDPVETAEVETEEVEKEEVSSETETESEESGAESELGTESEEESEEEVEEETEEEEPEENLPSQYHRSTFKEIKEKYPTFFKDFPSMREVYFREREFTNLFSTVEDAQESLNQAETLQAIEKDLRLGSTKALLDALDQTDRRSTVRVVENFLPQVYQRSPDLYYQVIGPVLEAFVRQVYEEGEKANNDNYKAAAQYVAQFAWGHTDMQKLGQKNVRQDPNLEIERQKIEKERAEFEEQKYKEVHSAVSSRAQKFLINEVVKSISTNKFDNEYVKTNVVRDIFAKVNEVLAQDPAHMKLMNSLWQKAQKSGFSPDSRNRLVSTLLARAQRILPAVRKEILSQIGKSAKAPQKQKVSPVGGKATPSEDSGSRTQSGRPDWSKYKSDSDFLNAFVDGKGKVSRV